MTWHFLRPHVPAGQALTNIAELKRGLANVRGSAFSPVLRAQQYLMWVETAETTLRDLFVDPALSRGLHTERYWRIRDIHETTLRAAPMIDAETLDQERTLDSISDQLGRFHSRLNAGEDERLMLLDTNVYMHGKPFRQVAWDALVEERKVILVVPLVVIDELDKAKDRGSDAARSTLRDLDSILQPDGTMTMAAVRNRVRIQLVDEPEAHERLEGNDDEIVRQASYFAAMASERITIVTRDRGMRVRAEAAGLAITMLPSELERSPKDRE